MNHSNPYAAVEELLKNVATIAIEFARAKNKSGIIRARYLARHLLDILPFKRPLRLSDKTGAGNGTTTASVLFGLDRRKR